MPIYEYRCVECDHRFELLRSMSAATAEVDCPGCGHAEVERQHSTFAAATGRAAAATAAPVQCCRGGPT